MDQLQIKALLGALIISLTLFIVVDLLIKKFTKNPKRPSEITTLCIVLTIGLLSIPQNIYSGLLIKNPLLLINSILGIVWLIGLWQMRKWAAVGYVISTLITVGITILQGQASIFQLILILPIALLFYFFPKMK